MNIHQSSQRLRRWICLCLSLVLITSIITPPALAEEVVRGLYDRSTEAANNLWPAVDRWLNSTKRSQDPVSRGVKPSSAESKAEKEARLARLEIEGSNPVIVQSQKPIWFTALPVDNEGSPIQGLKRNGNQVTSKFYSCGRTDALWPGNPAQQQ